jgi:hypothetical protein
MSLVYRLLADLTVIVHFGYVMFVIFGLLLTLVGGLLKWQWVRNRAFRILHLVMILVVVLESWAGIPCPLTKWESQLRKAAGQQSYQGDFIANWVHDALFVQLEPWVFTLCYSLFGGLVLLTLFLIPPRWKSSATHPSGMRSDPSDGNAHQTSTNRIS